MAIKNQVLKVILIRILKNILCFCGLTLIIIFFGHCSELCTFFHVLLFIGCMLFFKKSDFMLFILAAIGFTLGEIFIMKHVIWVYYSYPSIWGIPSWLPLSWGFVAVLIKKLSYNIDRLLYVLEE